MSDKRPSAPDCEDPANQPDVGWLRLAWSVLRLFFWASVVVIRFTMRFIAGAIGMALGFWFGHRLVQAIKHRGREPL